MKKLLYSFFAVLLFIDAAHAQFREVDGGFLFTSKVIIVFETGVMNDEGTQTLPYDDRVIDVFSNIQIAKDDSGQLLVSVFTPDAKINLKSDRNIVQDAVDDADDGGVDVQGQDANSRIVLEMATFFEFLEHNHTDLWEKVYNHRHTSER